nr:hypothetical protein [bacterium]
TRYLEHVSARVKAEQGGEETIADIETRIAEIFGGGEDPPRLVGREIVDRMIDIMGAPEEFNAESGTGRGEAAAPRKPLYDPDSLAARAGKTLSVCGRTFRGVMAGLFRIASVCLGAVFTVFGFILLFMSAAMLLLHNTPMVRSLIEPDVQNIPMLLSIALGSDMAQSVLMLAAIVFLIPLAALTYLGIKLIFRIGACSKLFKVIVFLVWIAALCALIVLLALRLSMYANHDHTEEKVKLDALPRTLWIAPLKKASDTGYDDKAAVGSFTFLFKSSTKQLFCTPELSIHQSDAPSGWISVEKTAYSKSRAQALKNARWIDFGWKVSRDTLYLDEYFKLPEGSPWNGSTLDIDLGLPEGTQIRPASGADLTTWGFHVHDPAVSRFRIEAGELQEITE